MQNLKMNGNAEGLQTGGNALLCRISTGAVSLVTG